MKRYRFYIYLIVSLLALSCIAFADTLKAPPPLPEESPAETQYLKHLYDNIHKLPIITTSPDASRRGDVGELIVRNNGGTYEGWVNTNGAKGWSTFASGGGSAYNTVQDEGSALTSRTILNCVGGGITCSDDGVGSRTTLNVPSTSTTPGGSDTQVQFNDGGSFGGDAEFTWNKTTDTMGLGLAAGTTTIRTTNQTTANTAGRAVSVITADGNGSGAGGLATLQAGAGGTTGTGGGVTITSGTATGESRNGGVVTIQSGDGGNTGFGGSGGAINVTGGAGRGSDSNGGAINITAGNGTGTAIGGAINIDTGDAGTGGDGGDLTLTTGRGSGAVDGGDIFILAASGGTGGVGGAIDIEAGAGTTATSTGGAVLIYSGGGNANSATGGNVTIRASGPTGNKDVDSGTVTIESQDVSGLNTGNTGNIIIQSGNTLGTNKNSGNVTLRPGTPTGSGTAGIVIVSRDSVTGVSTELTTFKSSSTTVGLADGTTLTNHRQNQILAPVINGVVGGGTETITNGSTLYLDAAPSGSNITFTNGPYTIFSDAGLNRFDGGLAIDGSTTKNVDGGQWTPTSNNIANLDSSSAAEGHYIRIETTVSGSIQLTVDPTLTATSTQLELDLPVASNFGATSDVSGSCGAPGIAGMVAAVTADTASDELEIRWISGDVTSQEIDCSFSYQII